MERIDAALPQTQCQRCGYPDCLSYARAIAEAEAPINRCPPGGAEGVKRLALLTAQAAQPLDVQCGAEGPRSVAVIDEDWCIGCTLCLAACPTDAILGMNKRMHVVVPEHCTGCELCVPACPVDCIHMENASGAATGWSAWSPRQADAARARYQARNDRLSRGAPASPPSAPAPDKRSVIEAALARARARRAR